MKTKWIMAMGMVAAMAFTATVQAIPNPINGSIGFNGTVVFDNAGDISSATKFTAFNSEYVAPGQQFGSYASVPDFTGVDFTPFTFSPAAAAVTPLWTFTLGATVYSFNATSMTATFDSVHNVWNIGGNGIAKITGFDDTEGSWNLSAGSQGASFFFGSATTVPDGGMTVMLLGGALSGLALLRKKLA